MRRRDFLKVGTSVVAGGALGARFGGSKATAAESRRDVLLSVSEGAPNALDYHTVGANRSVFAVVWNTYDRLITFGVKKSPDGNGHYDYTDLQPALAEDIDLKDMSVTLRLRRDATFHDGTPITAHDVKWTFDRAIGVGAYPASTMAAASLTHPEQFVAVDDHTFRVDFDKHDKLSPLYLGVPVVGIYNSKLVKQHVTPQDPWGQEFTKRNLAGGGAYKLESWHPGQDVVLVANPDWRCGPQPQIKRVIWRTVPAAGTRRALLERGDVDLSFDLPPKDSSELAANKDMSILGVPMESTVLYLGMNVTMPPFDNPKVRQAVAYAVPYQSIMETAIYNRGRPLFGASSRVATPEWPQAHQYVTDIAKAKQLLAEAGHQNGFETTLSFDLGSAVTVEPLSILVQESLAKIGIKVTLDKIPGANWRTAFSKKQLPMQINLFGAWFDYADYFFNWVYSGRNTIFNTMSYKNPAMDALINDARFTTDKAAYQKEMVQAIQLAFDDVPNVPLYQPYLDVAMRKNVSGYTYWFHREMDYRSLVKT
jgi:peptide/nickel transport system substrate-binding protein